MSTITPTQGNLGSKSNKNNLLTYSISGTMATITEKVNGVVVGTRNAPASGQTFTVSLTQAQWDAVRFGKYKDTSAGLNTLTIEMGSETFTYTFDKQPDANADFLTVTKAVKDAQEIRYPAIKKKLVDKVGGNVADSFETIIAGLSTGRKFASGTVIYTASGAVTFARADGSTIASVPSAIVTGLSFTPSTILMVGEAAGTNGFFTVLYPETFPLGSPVNNGRIITGNSITGATNSSAILTNYKLDGSSAYVNNGGFRMPLAGTQNHRWYAYE